ncbi:MAG: SH3 domain-containing protein [Anaerolineae bacterium]
MKRTGLRSVIGWLVILGMLMIRSTAWAQAEVPAYLALNGHLYRWTTADGLVRVETCDTPDTRILRLSASPDGQYLALNLVTESFFMEGGAPTPRGDLYWCDPVNGVVRQLTEGNKNNTSTARRGVWSPDGARLAWSEVNPDFSTAAIRVYDPVIDRVNTLVESTPLTYACGSGPNPPEISWNSTGIAAPYWISSAADACISEQLGVYVYDDTNGTLIANLSVGETGDYTSLDSVAWAAGAQDRLIVSQSNTRYLVTLDGRVSPISGGIEWALAASGQPTRSALPFEGTAIGVSPDGRAALSLIETNLYTVIDGVIGVIDLTTVEPDMRSLNVGQDIAWAALRPQISTETPNTLCSRVEPLHYRGASARVISGMGANNVRLAPFSNAEVVGQIPEGGEMQVIFETDICSGGIVWRYVSYDGVTGWTAESQGETAYLERVGE